ncbi:hypothetical protein F4809DRAFT_423791 [Biscogniauxia mediterranea]|nr:hypothetical protein F4809DRAFT_423791 [Biscogniauxia mediterranea]
MEPLNLVLKEIDCVSAPDATNDDFRGQIADILHNYLTTEEHSRNLINTTTRSITDLLTEPPKSPEGTAALAIIWDLCCVASEQIPTYHDGQMKLAELVIGLGNSCETGYTAPWEGYTVHLYKLVRPDHITISSIPREICEKTSQAWINKNAFWARLNTLSRGFAWGICFCVLRDTFQNTASHDYTTLNYRVPAAAQWIFLSGEHVLKALRSPPPPEGKIISKEIPPWTFHTWFRWKAGFRSAAYEHDLQPETRELAKSAASFMDYLEDIKI